MTTFPCSPRGLAWLAAALIALAPGIAGAQQPEPPAPAGYKSNAEVMAAIALKRIKLIETPKEPPPEVIEEKGVQYGTGSGRPLLLDLFRPATRAGAAPGILFVHGGAWSGGNRDQLRYYAIHFARRGYVTAAISYRLTREAPFPAAIEDTKCAVRWMRANAESLGVNPGSIGLSGNSAGGHLSLLAGYAPNHAELEGAGGHTGASSEVQAIVNFYGPYDLTTDFAKSNRVVLRFLQNKTFEAAPELYRLASPSFHLDKADPPTLVLHGTIDDVVPIEQSDRLVERLRELGVPHRYERLEGWPHAMDAAEEVNRRCLYLMEEFFDKHLPVAPAAR